MKTALALLLMSSVALADPPRTFPAGDGCNTCTDYGHDTVVCTVAFCIPRPIVLAQSVVVPADAPLADPDAQGRALKLDAGEIAPFKGVLLDEQEDVHRERGRVRAETGEQEWRTIAYASIGAGAAVTVALALLTGLAAAHKL